MTTSAVAVRQVKAVARPDEIDPHTHSLVEGWLLEYKRSPSTVRNYRKDVHLLAIFLHGLGVTLTGTHRIHLAGWADSLRGAGLSEATIGRRLSSASSFFTWAVQNEFMASNPAKDLRRPPRSVDEDGAAWLSVQQADRFLDAAREHSVQAYALVALMLTTAARVSEVTTAQVSDIGYTGGHRVLIAKRKGGKRQNLPIAPWVGQAIDEHPNGRTEGPLFTTRAGMQMNQPAAWRLVRTLARKAGLENAEQLHPHSLRHTAITAALEGGSGLREVQSLAGHVDPRTTERYDRMRARLDTSPAYALAATFARK